MEKVNSYDILSIISSIGSIVISVFAVWLSVTFYKLSNKSSEDIKHASNSIEKTINRLETIFDKLYTDTFSMVKDTMSDMRQHIWKAPKELKINQIDNETIENITRLREEFSKEISTIISKQTGSDKKYDKLNEKIDSILERLIDKTRQVEEKSKSSFNESEIIQAITELNMSNVSPTLRNLSRYFRSPESQIINLLFSMGSKNILSWPGAPDNIKSNDIIEIIKSAA